MTLAPVGRLHQAKASAGFQRRRFQEVTGGTLRVACASRGVSFSRLHPSVSRRTLQILLPVDCSRTNTADGDETLPVAAAQPPKAMWVAAERTMAPARSPGCLVRTTEETISAMLSGHYEKTAAERTMNT